MCSQKWCQVPSLPTAVVLTVTYGELHLGFSRVPICLCNLSAHTMEIPTKTVVGQVVPANQVQLVVHPTRTSKESNPKPQKGWVLGPLDLQGLKEWPELEQKQTRELLLKWEHVFVCSDLDLGKTALIKHKIEVMDWTSFKEHYPHIPPHMYDDIRAHIQEMLDIGAIQKSHSPWASTVVLVQKKDSRPTHLNLVSSCRNEITFYSSRASCTDEPDPGNHRRPSFSWFCQPYRERLL